MESATITSLMSKKAAAMKAAGRANENGGGFVPGWSSLDELELDRAYAQYDRDRAAAFAAEWTVDVLAARRAEWNAAVKAGAFTGANGKVDGKLIAAFRSKFGWDITEITHAKELHGIK
jgi:hypothetical protein